MRMQVTHSLAFNLVTHTVDYNLVFIHSILCPSLLIMGTVRSGVGRVLLMLKPQNTYYDIWCVERIQQTVEPGSMFTAREVTVRGSHSVTSLLQ